MFSCCAVEVIATANRMISVKILFIRADFVLTENKKKRTNYYEILGKSTGEGMDGCKPEIV